MFSQVDPHQACSFRASAFVGKALLLTTVFLSCASTEVATSNRASYVVQAGNKLPHITDSKSLLSSSPDKATSAGVRALFQDFHQIFSEPHLGKWAVHSHLVLVDENLNEPLHTFADYVAETQGLGTSKNASGKATGIVLALQCGGQLSSIALGGSLLADSSLVSEPLLQESPNWVQAEQLAIGHLRKNDIVAAVRVLLDSIVTILSRANSLQTLVGNAPEKIKQDSVVTWKTKYQEGAVETNNCGGKVCLELYLDNVRQFSEEFENYYHEGMTHPALMILGSTKQRRVLILGGGDGGIARECLRYPNVHEVINIDIDEAVTIKSKEYFPRVSSGLPDSRLKMLHEDALAWLKKEEGDGGKFDLVLVDFTDDPIDGIFTMKLHKRLRALLTDDGIIVHNLGTLLMGYEKISEVFSKYVKTMGSVFPLSLITPDYESPYLLCLSSADPDMKPLEAPDWEFWESLKLDTKFYGGRSQHEALFQGNSAEAGALFGLPTIGVHRPLMPSPIKLPFHKIVSGRGRKTGNVPERMEDADDEGDDEEVVFKTVSPAGTKIAVLGDKPHVRTLYLNAEEDIGSHTEYREESMVLPALNMLGSRAKRVLVLGGGTGSLARLILQWPSLEKLVVLEKDEAVIKVTKDFFPERARALEDPRVELIMQDAFDWMAPGNEGASEGNFDLVVVAVKDLPWRKARETTRIPKTAGFYRQLGRLAARGGLIVQEAGSRASLQKVEHLFALHRANFAKTWPMSISILGHTLRDGKDSNGFWYRPPGFLLLSSVDKEQLDPCQIDWENWQTFEAHAQEIDAPELLLYHPSMHCSLFTLAAEVEGFLDTKSIPSMSEQIANKEASGWLVHDAEVQAFNCSKDKLNDGSALDTVLEQMAKIGGLTVLSKSEHKFTPQGISALLLVSESHLSAHTWPDLGYAVLDVVSCKAIPTHMRKMFRAVVTQGLNCARVDLGFQIRGRALASEAHHPVREDL